MIAEPLFAIRSITVFTAIAPSEDNKDRAQLGLMRRMSCFCFDCDFCALNFLGSRVSITENLGHHHDNTAASQSRFL